MSWILQRCLKVLLLLTHHTDEYYRYEIVMIGFSYHINALAINIYCILHTYMVSPEQFANISFTDGRHKLEV